MSSPLTLSLLFAAGTIALLGAVVVAQDQFDFLDNGVITLGIDTTKGGVIGWLSPSGSQASVINIFDFGRSVQESWYSGPKAYDNCEWAGGPWPWNPIGSGDAFGHATTILAADFNQTTGAATIVSRPLQWACDDVPCECTFTKQIQMDGTAVTVRASIANNRSDHTDYGLFNQEQPAAYTIGTLSTLTCYTGTAPFTGDTLTNWTTPSGPFPWSPGEINCTENWVAFVESNGAGGWFGMGLYVEDLTTFLTGFAGTLGTGGPYDFSTGYMAALRNMAVPWNAQLSYEFSLVLGDLSTIRAWVYQHHAARSQKSRND